MVYKKYYVLVYIRFRNRKAFAQFTPINRYVSSLTYPFLYKNSDW